MGSRLRRALKKLLIELNISSGTLLYLPRRLPLHRAWASFVDAFDFPKVCGSQKVAPQLSHIHCHLRIVRGRGYSAIAFVASHACRERQWPSQVRRVVASWRTGIQLTLLIASGGPLVGLWESLLGEEEREREFLDERVSSSSQD